MIYYILAQIPSIEHIDKLADKDFKWWFTAMFVIGLLGTIYIFKQQQIQSADQRKSHAEMTDKLIQYITQDHAKAVSTVEMAMGTMNKLGQTLEKSTIILERVAGLLEKHQP